MNASLFILVCVTLVYVVRILLVKENTKTHVQSLVVSYFVIVSTVLAYGFSVYALSNYSDPTGSFGDKIRLEPFILILFFLFWVRNLDYKPEDVFDKYFLFGLLGLFLLSFLNPYNITKDATIIALYGFLALYFFYYIVCKTIDLNTIFVGLYDGFLVSVIIQVCLSVLFPILDYKEALSWFREGKADARRGGAVGTFSHPNVLALFMTYCVSFFWACYLREYRKNQSLFFLFLSFFVVILTYSRSAILSALIIFVILYIINKKPSIKLFSIQILFTIVLPCIIVLGIVVFLTPLEDLFLSENASDMYYARLAHWIYGLEMFKSSPILGIGINSHIYYLREETSIELLNEWLASDFATTNPIHNILVIMLCETGIIGFGLYLWFLFGEVTQLKKYLTNNGKNTKVCVLCLFELGIILTLFVHGFSDWAPFSFRMIFLWLFCILLVRYARRTTRTVPVLF